MKESDHIPEDLSMTAEQAKRKINHEFSASKKWSVGCFIGAAAAGLFSAAAAEVNQDELALASMGSGIVGAPMVAVTKYSRARKKSKKNHIKFLFEQ